MAIEEKGRGLAGGMRASIIGTAGHVDHGKTTLVRALTGMSTDRLPEEKKRGITIDVGFAYMDVEAKGAMLRLAIVDVPGHERFIENMLAGATGIRAVLFAVAADDGVMPQTREHLDIIRLLGIKNCVFAITKSDLADSERIRRLGDAISGLVENTPLAGSPILPVSAATGQGVEGLKAELVKIATGRSVAESGGFFRLPVDRSFHVKGFGTIVTGTVASGGVVAGDELLCFHSGSIVKVRGIQAEADQAVKKLV
ncbi:MAG: selenocysteine-specific translation elongation factor, partial [Deltaproteobacteria bacterium]